MADKKFNSDSFYKAVTDVMKERDASWKLVSDQTGISPSTLTRISKGGQADAPSLAALSAWSGINPGNFVNSEFKPMINNSISQISSLLRSDPKLDAKAAESLEAILKVAYDNMKKD
jgi:transcriptional regulator with XRE-family HTH domain